MKHIGDVLADYLKNPEVVKAVARDMYYEAPYRDGIDGCVLAFEQLSWRERDSWERRARAAIGALRDRAS